MELVLEVRCLIIEHQTKTTKSLVPDSWMLILNTWDKELWNACQVLAECLGTSLRDHANSHKASMLVLPVLMLYQLSYHLRATSDSHLLTYTLTESLK